ncbi:outer membrane protein [Dysgonomonas sp. Marseille-P4361]|uniref:outer membrane protein n=1 Tax=Dysgonomonas sp. Marseille-P4361 TaxID=2161820 RepID=UPI000D55D801|nr:outer membrane beta-barrel protein [Dysgonomonas sp. Marseille-P4361]
MKKVILAVLLAVFSLGLHAQSGLGKGEKAAVFQAGYQSDPGRFMIGVEGRYNIANNFRLAPDVMLMFPKNKVLGFDANVNFHYVFPLESQLNIYPLAGLSMLNNRYTGDLPDGVGKGATDWGFNLGGGFEYNLSSSSFLNLEMKYTFSDLDHFTVGFGYGIRF